MSEVGICEAVRRAELGMCQWVGQNERKEKGCEGIVNITDLR